MTDPITPPPELVDQWRTAPEYATGLQKLSMVSMTTDRLQEIATQAAQWGADQELKACCEWLDSATDARGIRIARRPKPPSLKEQALEALNQMDQPLGVVTARRASIIRLALEALPND